MKNRSWIFHLPLYPAIYFCHFNWKPGCLLAGSRNLPSRSSDRSSLPLYHWFLSFYDWSLSLYHLFVFTLSLLCYHFIIDQRKPGRELGLATSPVVPLIIFGATSLLAGILVLILPETRCHYHREPHNHHDQCYYVIFIVIVIADYPTRLASASQPHLHLHLQQELSLARHNWARWNLQQRGGRSCLL